MTKKTYAEKLRDPRWQRMRLKVMERDGFACRRCGDTRSTLNVHHMKYVRGCEPWDYPTAGLETLCESCHREHHEAEKRPAFVPGAPLQPEKARKALEAVRQAMAEVAA